MNRKLARLLRTRYRPRANGDPNNWGGAAVNPSTESS